MPSRLANFQAVLAATWAGLVPADDGSGLAYRLIDTLDEERGNGQHREFQWSDPSRARFASEGALQIDWACNAEVFLHRRDRTRNAFRLAIADEVLDLQRAFSRLTNLGAGVIEVVLDDVVIETASSSTKARAGGARRPLVVRASFPFRALIGEE